MRKKLKRYGNTLVINFNTEERDIIGGSSGPLSEGDIINFTINDIETREAEK